MAITISSALRGGLAGAGVLSVVQEIIRKLDNNNLRPEALGINAIAKVVKGGELLNQKPGKLPVAGEILSNALYFSLAGFGAKRNVLMRSALLGLTAGLGTLILPQHLGLTEEADRPLNTKIKTIAGYFLGSMIAAAAIKAFQKNSKKSKSIS